jgi:hypothetical protein
VERLGKLVKIINLHEVEKEALICKRGKAVMSVEPDDMLRLLGALREANSRAASGIGYIQWHGIIDVEGDALRGSGG